MQILLLELSFATFIMEIIQKAWRMLGSGGLYCFASPLPACIGAARRYPWLWNDEHVLVLPAVV